MGARHLNGPRNLPAPEPLFRPVAPRRLSVQGQSCHFGRRPTTSGLPLETDIVRAGRHVSKVPCVDGSGLARRICASQAWSVLPCVRPLGAVHMTAGHNALRGSGPGQQHAFDDAMAQVGCPDRRIDRLCITCCSPSQPSHHAGCPARSRLPGKCRGLFVTLALGHYGPCHPRDLVGERNGSDLCRATAE
jgi:hypothetical protein